jgi:hypothetical protein
MHSESILVRIPSKRDDSQKPKRPPKPAGGRKKAENLDLALINHLDEALLAWVSNRGSRHAEDLPGRGKGDKACNVAHILGWIAAYAKKLCADLPEA